MNDIHTCDKPGIRSNVNIVLKIKPTPTNTPSLTRTYTSTDSVREARVPVWVRALVGLASAALVTLLLAGYDETPNAATDQIDLPITNLPPVPEKLRYCCSLECPTIHPSSCTPSCQQVSVGPCPVFTVNCPGTLSEGNCTWE